MHFAKSLKGSTGAIKDILELNNNIIASCGMDRFLRLFNYKTSEDLPQIYLKNKLTVIYPYEEEKEQTEEDNKDEEEDNSDEYDDDSLMMEDEEEEEDEDFNEEEEDDES